MKKIVLSLFLLVVAAFAAVNTKTCVGCHGQDFEKSAMGKSKIVKDMTKQEVSDALIGYKNDTYGGTMKAVMKNQVAKYSNEDLQSTGIGKQDAEIMVINVVKSPKASNVVYYIANHFAYKEGDKCWVVDYANKKSNLVDCKVLKAKLDLKEKNLLPPVMSDEPSVLFDGLFK
jgi:cytochrome c-type protein NapB